MSTQACRIATCDPLPEPDPDERLLIDALAEHGVQATMAAWHDRAVPWDDGQPVVIRSTWNYYRDRDAFLRWAERVERAAPLWNPLPVVRWSSHKGYLRDLRRWGIPTVPTAFVPAGAAPALREVADTHGWHDVIVKPVVSAGSFGTRRFRADALGAGAGDAHLAALSADGEAMVQPYIASVEDYGERALVWIDGRLSHAVRKTVRLDGEDEAVSDALPIADDERALAEAVMQRFAGLLYARVDLARDADGRPLVMELELVEPSLFLAQHPPALRALARAIATRAATRAPSGELPV